MVCSLKPHWQVVFSASVYPHFSRLTLHLPTPDLGRLRHLHSDQLESAPFGSSSLAFTELDIDVGCLSSLSLQRVSRRCIDPSGCTEFKKLCLDFNRLAAWIWPNNGCLSSETCRILSLLLAAWRRISGGAIPARIYRSSVDVGLRQPETRRQVALRAGLILSAWADLSQTGNAYSVHE